MLAGKARLGLGLLAAYYAVGVAVFTLVERPAELDLYESNR